MLHSGSVVVGLGEEGELDPAIDWAAGTAQQSGQPLHLVRAYHLADPMLPWQTALDRTLNDRLHAVAQQVLDRARDRVAIEYPQVKVESFAVDGPAARVLREASEDADITVVGSRRRGALGTAVLGSVSSVVAAAGFGPVVVVRSPIDPDGDQDAGDRCVVVGVDGASSMFDVLMFAFGHASRHGYAVRAVFCWQPGLFSTPSESGVELERGDHWLAAMLADAHERYPGVQVHRAVICAHPVTGLVAESSGQELLVVGARSRRARFGALLGSVSQGTLHHASCPVAVIHPR
ncbi:MAG: universal stress protein [Jatrophihabitans sp.]